MQNVPTKAKTEAQRHKWALVTAPQGPRSGLEVASHAQRQKKPAASTRGTGGLDTCLRHASDGSTRTSLQCAWEATGCGADITGDGTRPRPAMASASPSWATIPTSPSKCHLYRVDFTSQHLALKTKSLFNGPFILVNRRHSADACPPRSHRAPNAETARESDSLTIKLGKF